MSASLAQYSNCFRKMQIQNIKDLILYKYTQNYTIQPKKIEKGLAFFFFLFLNMYIIPLKSGGEKKCYASTLVVNGGTNYDKGEKASMKNS